MLTGVSSPMPSQTRLVRAGVSAGHSNGGGRAGLGQAKRVGTFPDALVAGFASIFPKFFRIRKTAVRPYLNRFKSMELPIAA